MHSIVTKGGDKGETGLFGGKRVPKDHPRIAAVGTVDEFNALLGIIVAEPELRQATKNDLLALQHLLFRVGADLATPLESTAKTHRVTPEHVKTVEDRIADIEPTLPAQTAFLLPGGCRASALLHHARAACRRAERETITLKHVEPVNEQVLILLNRLSDYLFLLARKANIDGGHAEVEVKY